MIYSADELIQKRKDLWQNKHSIFQDKKLRQAIANEIIKNEQLRSEVQEYPEKLIELLFVVVDKDKNVIPFFLNEVQNDFIKNVLNKAKKDFENREITDISILILKGRQQGFTTAITAYQLACSITQRNFEGITLADESSNTEAIFQNKAKYVYNQLPDAIKPTEKFNNKRQLLFENLNSSWSADTATKDVGRSRTINFLHGSEVAFWRNGVSSILAGLGEALTKSSVKIFETTANGFNDFREMWKSGAHINVFYEWWRTKEYRIEFASKQTKENFLQRLDAREDWIYERLRWLKYVKHLEDEQLWWYYSKYKKMLNKELIKQEYPCTPDEAFLSSGNCVFDKDKIITRIDEAPKPLKIGYFEYDYNDTLPAFGTLNPYTDRPYEKNKISNIKWVNDPNGYIKIYKVPNTPHITKYGIGGDTAGDGSDFFTGHVLDAKTGEQVAVLKHQMDADLYSKQMYCLGMYYKQALVGIESNFDSFPIKELQRLGYPNLYIREREDKFSGIMEKSYGFRTTSVTRPVIISNLVRIVRDTVELINDSDTLKEMLMFIKNEKGRAEAQEGEHDDLVMGLAIAYRIIEQVVFMEDEIIIQNETQLQFQSENEDYSDYGEDIEII